MKNIYATILILCFAGFFSLNANSQDLKWVKAIQSGYSEWIYDMKTDHSGNVWLCGLYNGPADFDPGPNEFILSPDNDYFISVAEYNASGEFIKAFKLPVSDVSSAIFNLNKNELLLTGVEDLDANKYLVMGINLDGIIEWSVKETGLGWTTANCIDNKYYISGKLWKNASLYFDNDTVLLTKNESSDWGDYFVARINESKHLELIFTLKAGHIGPTWGGTSPLSFSQVVSDKEGNMYFAGQALYEADIDPGDGGASFSKPTVFLVSYTPDGNYRWARGINHYNLGCGLILANSNDQVMLCLNHGTTMKKDTDDLKAINFCSFSLHGDSLFSYAYGIALSDHNGIKQMKFQDDGTYYTIGGTDYKSDIDPGEGVYMLDSGSYFGTFIAKYSSDHDLIWADQIANFNQSSAHFDKADIFDQGFILAGFYGGAPDFDFSARVVTTPEGTQGNFIAKYRSSLSVPEENAGSAVSVYPNPFKDKALIEFKNSNAGFVRLYDLEGRMLKTFYPVNAKQVEIDLENRTPGIYLYKAVDAEGNIISGRLIKTK